MRGLESRRSPFISQGAALQQGGGCRWLLSCRRRSQRRSHVVRADLTAGFLEAVASAALKARLQSHSLVECQIECDGFGLLAGRVDSVAIAGRDWLSPVGLSARVLDMTLGQAALDVPAILSQQRILLLGVPQGRGRIVFTAAQFDVFLQHPLMLEAAATAVQGQRFAFEPGTVSYDLAAGKILFAGVWVGSSERYELSMQPRGAAAIVQPLPAAESVEGAAAVANELTRWFSDLTLNLQGPELTYSGMELISSDDLQARSCILPAQLRQTAQSQQFFQASEPVLDLRLDVRVLGFPPSKLAF